MKAIGRFCLALLWLWTSWTAAHGAVDAQAVLAASDAVRNPSRPFSTTVTLLEFRQGKQTDTSVLNVLSKADESSGQFRTLIRIAAPERDLNKLMLKNGNDLWFYDPASQSSIRLSPQQRLLGQVSNGDVVTVNLAKDYKAELLAEEDTVDGEKTARRAYKLKLSAAAPDAPYHRVEMWVETGTSRPIKARFFAESGHLLKTAYYRKFQAQLGRDRPTEVVVIDGLAPSWVTVMRYQDFAWTEVPEAWLQRDYLPRFKPN